MSNQSCPFCGSEGFTPKDLQLHLSACAHDNGFSREEADPIIAGVLDVLMPPPPPEAQPVSERKRPPRPCLCGCGLEVKSRRGKFLPGHDAKLKGTIMRELRPDMQTDPTGKKLAGAAAARDVTPEAWAYAKAMWSHLIPELKEI